MYEGMVNYMNELFKEGKKCGTICFCKVMNGTHFYRENYN